MVASCALPRIMRAGRGAADEPDPGVAGLGLHRRPLLVTDAFLAATRDLYAQTYA